MNKWIEALVVRREETRTQRYVWPTILLVAVAIVPFAAAVGPPPPPSLDWSPATNGSHDYGSVEVNQIAGQMFTLANVGGRGSGSRGHVVGVGGVHDHRGRL